MDELKVKDLTVQIAAKREERDSYKREAKRCQEEIDALDLLRDQAIMSRSEQMRLDVIQSGSDV